MVRRRAKDAAEEREHHEQRRRPQPHTIRAQLRAGATEGAKPFARAAQDDDGRDHRHERRSREARPRPARPFGAQRRRDAHRRGQSARERRGGGESDGRSEAKDERPAVFRGRACPERRRLGRGRGGARRRTRRGTRRWARRWARLRRQGRRLGRQRASGNVSSRCGGNARLVQRANESPARARGERCRESRRRRQGLQRSVRMFRWSRRGSERWPLARASCYGRGGSCRVARPKPGTPPEAGWVARGLISSPRSVAS